MPFSYIDFTRWVFEESGLTSTERLVLLALGRYAGHADRPGRPAGTCFPAQARLAKDASVAPRTVVRVINRLAERGTIGQRCRKGKVTLYDLRQTITCDRRSHVTDDHTGCDPVSQVVVTDDHTGCDPVSHDQIKIRSADPTKTGGGVARTREDQPPTQGLDQTNDERATQTAGHMANIRQQGEEHRSPGRQAGERRLRRQHPRERVYTNDLLNPEAEQIHKLLLEHKLPLNSPTGTANHIAGRIGPLGNNKLTLARVKLAVEAVADKCAFAAADGAPRTTEEVWDHLQSFLRYSDSRWKELERKRAADQPRPALDAPAYHRPAEPDLPPDFKPAPPPPGLAAAVARIGNGGTTR